MGVSGAAEPGAAAPIHAPEYFLSPYQNVISDIKNYERWEYQGLRSRGAAAPIHFFYQIMFFSQAHCSPATLEYSLSTTTRGGSIRGWRNRNLSGRYRTIVYPGAAISLDSFFFYKRWGEGKNKCRIERERGKLTFRLIILFYQFGGLMRGELKKEKWESEIKWWLR